MASGQADWTSKANVTIQNASITVVGSGTFTVSGSVSITGTPSVTISGTPSVAIDQVGSNNTVQITGTPTVSVSGTVTVSISGTPTVSISGTPTVNIGSTNTIQISQSGGQNTIQIASVSAAGSALWTAGNPTPRTDQTGVVAYKVTTAGSTWQTIYTVTTGKTLYVTQITFWSTVGSDAWLEFGVSSTAKIYIDLATGQQVAIPFLVPLSFAAGTVLQLQTEGGSNMGIIVAGWEE